MNAEATDLDLVETRRYWNVRQDQVPQQTGVGFSENDLERVAAKLKVDLSGSVLDVGCGTGRHAPLCGSYTGVDITPAMVEYARTHGADASLIDGPDDLTGRYDTIICLSVFTHIPRAQRQAYLAKFKQIATRVLVDIIPGEEGGVIGLWGADPDDFAADLKDAGFKVLGTCFLIMSGSSHMYFHCRAAR